MLASIYPLEAVAACNWISSERSSVVDQQCPPQFEEGKSAIWRVTAIPLPDALHMFSHEIFTATPKVKGCNYYYPHVMGEEAETRLIK